MKCRIFGKTGISVREIGLGTWQFGGDWGNITESNALEILNTAVDNGVNFFDTADVYGAGISEQIIGMFIKQRQEKIFVATKLGRLYGYPDSYSLNIFRQAVENSLKRLGVEILDLIQLHCIPKHHLQNGEVFEWLRVLKQEGKIKYFGASVESMEEALICLKQNDISSLQIIFNIFRQNPIELLFEKAKQNKVALIIRLPLASGLLTGKFTKETKFSPEDHRNYNRDGQQFNVGETFSGLVFEKGVELAEKLKTFVPANISMAQFALRWILDYDAVSVIIPGATKTEHVLSNVQSSNLEPLSSELHNKLTEFYQAEIEQHIRGIS